MAAAPDVQDFEYTSADRGNKTHADFNNNPGNIKGMINGRKTDYAEYLDSVGIEYEMGSVAADGGVFIKFKTPEDGYRAAQLWWPKVKSWSIYGNRGKNKMTLDEALRKYSGGGVDKTKGYDLAKLKQGAEGRLDSIDGNTDISEITDDQWAKIMNEQMRWEDVNYYNKLKSQNIITDTMTADVPEVDDQSEGTEGEGENVVINDDDGSQNQVAFEGDLEENTEYQTIEYESVEEAKEKQDELNDGDFVVINDKTYRYDKESKELIRINDQAEIIESVDLGEFDRGQDLEEEQEEVVEEVEEEEQEQQEEEVVTEERGDDPNTPASEPEPKESDRQRVSASDMEIGKYYTILDPEKSEIVDRTGNLQDGVARLTSIAKNGDYYFQNLNTGRVFIVPAKDLENKLAKANKGDITLPKYKGVTVQPDTQYVVDGKAYSREDIIRLGGGDPTENTDHREAYRKGFNSLLEGKSEKEKKEIYLSRTKSQNLVYNNEQLYDVYDELGPTPLPNDKDEDGVPDNIDIDAGDGTGQARVDPNDKDNDGIPDTIDIDGGDGTNQPVTSGDKPEGDKPEGEITNLQRAGAIGKNLLQGAGALLDAVGGPGAIVSYIMGKKGMEAAMKEIEPQAMPELSPTFMQHLRQTKELAKRGFHPDQEREFRKELDTSYRIGLENAVRGSAGQRARFLAQSGVLDAQRSSALLDFAAKDAELQSANQDKYEKMMLFKENFDLQRSEQQRAEDMARQREEKEAAAGFVGSAFTSLMNSYSNMNTSSIMNKMVNQGMQNIFNPNTIAGLRNQDAFKNNETYQNITDE